jgi:hypothetical protein
MKGKQACCVALYDWKDGADVAKWLAYCERLFERAGKEIGFAAVQASGFSGKPVTFKKIRKKLEDEEVLERCHSIDLFAMEHRKFHSAMFGWRIQMAMVKSETPILFFGFDEIIGICGEQLVKGIFGECLKWSLPAYGIAYSREFEKSPDGYAGGIIAGLGYSPDEEIESGGISDWMHEQIGERRHLKGMLRDVYRWNFLSEAHLAHPCGSTTLNEWISSDERRGTLEPLGRERHCWSVPENQVALVRGELHRHGLLIARPY